MQLLVVDVRLIRSRAVQPVQAAADAELLIVRVGTATNFGITWMAGNRIPFVLVLTKAKVADVMPITLVAVTLADLPITVLLRQLAQRLKVGALITAATVLVHPVEIHAIPGSASPPVRLAIDWIQAR